MCSKQPSGTALVSSRNSIAALYSKPQIREYNSFWSEMRMPIAATACQQMRCHPFWDSRLISGIQLRTSANTMGSAQNDLSILENDINGENISWQKERTRFMSSRSSPGIAQWGEIILILINIFPNSLSCIYICTILFNERNEWSSVSEGARSPRIPKGGGERAHFSKLQQYWFCRLFIRRLRFVHSSIINKYR